MSEKVLNEARTSELWAAMKGYVEEQTGGHGGSGNGIIQWEDINGRPDLSEVSSMYVESVVLSASLWGESNQQQVFVEKVVADENQQLIVPVPQKSSKQLYDSCMIECVDNGEFSLTFQCETVPTDDVYVNVFIFEAAEVKEEYSKEFVWWSPHMTSYNTPSPYAVTESSITASTDKNGWNAFDGDDFTIWHSLNNPNQAITFDFGEPTYVKGVSFKAYPTSTNDWYKYIPKAFTFDGSNDGSTWEEIYQSDGTEYPTVEPNAVHSYETPVKRYRYYKITSNGNYQNNNFFIVSEIQFLKMEDEA